MEWKYASAAPFHSLENGPFVDHFFALPNGAHMAARVNKDTHSIAVWLAYEQGEA